jgi:hypothetical protein
MIPQPSPPLSSGYCIVRYSDDSIAASINSVSINHLTLHCTSTRQQWAISKKLHKNHTPTRYKWGFIRGQHPPSISPQRSVNPRNNRSYSNVISICHSHLHHVYKLRHPNSHHCFAYRGKPINKTLKFPAASAIPLAGQVSAF